MSDPGTSAPRPAGPGPADLVEIYYAPSEVFERRRNGGFGVPLIVFAVAVTAIYYATASAMQPLMDLEFAKAAAAMKRQNPELTDEQLAGFGKGAAMFGGISVLVMVGLIGPMLTGLLTWLVGKFAGVKQTLKAALVVGVFSMFPIIIEMIVNAVQALLLDEASITSRYSLSLGPARFLAADTSAAVLAMVGHIDVFTIWIAVLIAIGVRITGRATSTQATIVAVVVWVLGLIPALGQAVQQGSGIE